MTLFICLCVSKLIHDMVTKIKSKKSLKWKIIEDITAHAHKSLGVIVRKNVRLPALRRTAKKKRYREIDVLLSSRVAGHTVNFAIECKDYSRPITSPNIDSFIGKLQDVGIAPQTSIFVSTSGFNESAIERASEVRMKTLVISEEDRNSLPMRISNAIQMVVFIVCFYKGITFQTQEPAQGEETFKYLTFYDRKGNVKTTIMDIVWSNWLQGKPPLTCGIYDYDIPIPSDWLYLADGKRSSASNFNIKLEVRAFVMKFLGDVEHHHFQDAKTGEIDRSFVNVKFSPENDSNINLLKTEEELSSALQIPADIKLHVGRIRLPKIVMDNNLMWPISKEAWNFFIKLNKKKLSQSDLQEIAAINWKSLWNPSPMNTNTL